MCVLGLWGDKCANGTAKALTWKEALAEAQRANNEKHHHFVGWRLPNKNEFVSILKIPLPAYNPQTFLPNLNQGENEFYWTSTSKFGNSNSAFAVNVFYSSVLYKTKTDRYYVRLVRNLN